MSFRREAQIEIADAGADEFGETIWITPTIRSVNGRPVPDPQRPAYEAWAVFDRNATGTQPGMSDVRRGGHAVLVVTEPIITIRTSELAYPIAQGDGVYVPADETHFRVVGSEPAMGNLIRLRLEDAEPRD